MPNPLRIAALVVLLGSLAAGAPAATAPGVVVDYPRAGSVFPPEFAPPTFLWHDDSPASRWTVTFEFADGGPTLAAGTAGDPPPRGEIDERAVAATNEIYEPTPYQASARSWRPDRALWDEVKRRSAGRIATATFRGYSDPAPDAPPVSRGSTTLTTSIHPLAATVFYRDVPLMPSAGENGVIKPLDKTAQKLIAWRLKDVSRDDSRVLLEHMPTCANCHSFPADGKTLAMDIDGPQGDKGAYAIVPIAPETVVRNPDVMTWNAFPGLEPGRQTLGFLSRISPDGRYVVSTVREALYVRNFWNYRFTQVFYPTRGILAVFDRTTGEIRALPGADDPDYVHCGAAWSPDGKWLVFSRAPARDPYDPDRPPATFAGDPNETPIRYDLYRIPFDGGRGGTAVPVAGASNNGMSDSFPRVSPDGKWIVWTQSANGLLMRPDSKLWIVPAEGGTPRELESNLALMNSWHSFSPNGHWLAFSSKTDTPYTEMYLTHLDDDGHASPAIRVENTKAANRAINLPELVALDYDDLRRITVPAVDHYEHFHRGNALAREGRFDEAIAAYTAALAGEHTDWRVGDWRIHDSLSKILLQIGQDERALEHVRESLRLNPDNAEMHGNLGYLLIARGELSEAMEHLDKAVRLAPGDPQARYNRGALRMQTGDADGAIEDFSGAIAANPRHQPARVARGMLRHDAGDLAGSIEDFDAAVGLDPNDPTARYFRAIARMEAGDLAGALRDCDDGLAVAPPDWPNRPALESLRSRVAEAAAAGR